jgi:hypothetical protein
MDFTSADDQHLKDVREVARVAHEVNRAYSAALNDHSHTTWDETPKNIQDSAIHGVMHTLMNPDTTPEQSHQVWAAYKVKDGWAFGLEKDVEKKLHPNLISYSELPIQQRTKDNIFQSIVREVYALLKRSRRENP